MLQKFEPSPSAKSPAALQRAAGAGRGGGGQPVSQCLSWAGSQMLHHLRGRLLTMCSCQTAHIDAPRCLGSPDRAAHAAICVCHRGLPRCRGGSARGAQGALSGTPSRPAAWGALDALSAIGIVSGAESASGAGLADADTWRCRVLAAWAQGACVLGLGRDGARSAYLTAGGTCTAAQRMRGSAVCGSSSEPTKATKQQRTAVAMRPCTGKPQPHSMAWAAPGGWMPRSVPASLTVPASHVAQVALPSRLVAVPASQGVRVLAAHLEPAGQGEHIQNPGSWRLQVERGKVAGVPVHTAQLPIRELVAAQAAPAASWVRLLNRHRLPTPTPQSGSPVHHKSALSLQRRRRWQRQAGNHG